MLVGFIIGRGALSEGFTIVGVFFGMVFVGGAALLEGFIFCGVALVEGFIIGAYALLEGFIIGGGGFA